MDVLESLVLKNAAQRAGQHVKRESGARAMMDGKEVYNKIGYHSEEELEAAFSSYL